jgi:formylglycine-generating enzyme required for sulfatase activity
MIVRIPKVLPETPAWADTFGVDVYGIFAGITVGEASQMLRWIEPGPFVMGSPTDERGRWSDEGPQHDVTVLNGFWLGQTPVTQAFYEAVVGLNPSRFQGDARRPVENVSWDDAVVFCDRLNRLLSEPGDLHARLPSEAEWEYACRAGTKMALYSDKDLTDETTCPDVGELAWYHANSENATHPVGQKLPNAWGLYDMLGNVWEWCEDAWHDNYMDAPTDGSAWLGEGTLRVSRGGSWAYPARLCRCAYRNLREPGLRFDFLGFRLVLAVRVKEDIRPFS